MEAKLGGFPVEVAAGAEVLRLYEALKRLGCSTDAVQSRWLSASEVRSNGCVDRRTARLTLVDALASHLAHQHEVA